MPDEMLQHPALLTLGLGMGGGVQALCPHLNCAFTSKVWLRGELWFWDACSDGSTGFFGDFDSAGPAVSDVGLGPKHIGVVLARIRRWVLGIHRKVVLRVSTSSREVGAFCANQP